MAAPSNVRKFISVVMADARTDAIAFSKNWNPGNYARSDHAGWQVKDVDREGCYGVINAHAGTANIKGIVLPVPWYRCENVEGVYTFTWLDDMIDTIREGGTNNKKVILSCELYTYNTSSIPSTPQGTDVGIVPDWIVDAGLCGGGNGLVPKIDNTIVRDAIIAWAQELFDRYGDLSYIEMIGFGETSRDYVGINSSLWNDHWIDIAEALAIMSEGRKAWAFIDHNGMVGNDYAKVITLQNTMDLGGIGYSVPDIISFFSNPSPAPPGVNIAQRGDESLLTRMNYGFTSFLSYNFTNSSGADRRLWTPSKPESQVVRNVNMTNDIVRWYSDNWYKATHPTWTVRIGEGGVSYNWYIYGTEDDPVPVDMPADFAGTATVNYIANAANAPANTAYPAGA